MADPANRKRGRGASFALFFIGSLVISGVAQASEVTPFGRFELQMISEPEPIKATLSGWGDQFDGGERQWAVGRIEAGVRSKNGFELSLFSRMLADLRMNEEAVQFYGKISRKESLEAGREVPVRVRINGFVGHGVRFGYLHEAGNWSVTGGFSLFSTSRLMAGGLSGQFTALSDSDYDFNAEVDYLYYRDVIFKRPRVEPADGLGWSLDLAGTWRMSESLRVEGSVEDVLAAVHWQDAPFTRAQANTAQKTFDENGFAVFRPLISGIEGYRSSYRQDLEPRYKTELSWQESQLSVLLRGQYQFGYGYAGLGVGYALADASAVTAVYWPKTESLGLELRLADWRFGLGADNLRWSDVRAVSISIGYGVHRPAY